MLILITLIFYFLIFIFDFYSLKKEQNIKQNLLYIFLFFISFSLALASLFQLPFPIISKVLRKIMNR